MVVVHIGVVPWALPVRCWTSLDPLRLKLRADFVCQTIRSFHHASKSRSYLWTARWDFDLVYMMRCAHRRRKKRQSVSHTRGMYRRSAAAPESNGYGFDACCSLSKPD